jgi:putative two-component system response regulator
MASLLQSETRNVIPETKEKDSSMDSSLKAQYEDEIHAPFTDSLTGLYNHGFFRNCLEREIKRSERHRTPFTLALIGIDSFSGYNRGRGSLEGDKMLRDIAAAIAGNIRETDLAARFMGDVFAVLLVMSDGEHAQAAAERIRNAVEDSTKGKLTVSIGMSACGTGATAESLIRRAQDALDQAKLRGKNRVHLVQKEQPAEARAQPRVLVVDDEPLNTRLFERMLSSIKYQVVKASGGEEALQIVHKTDLDLILLDVMMPGMDGFTVCRRLKSDESTRLIPVIMVTALSDTQDKLRGIEAGADDFITKPPNMAELLARCKSLVQMKTLNDNLTSIEAVLISMANAIEARDQYTEGHVQRVAHLAVEIGKRMKLPESGIKDLKLGGILHDIGKIKVPDAILNKPGPLTDEEREIMKTHADAGYQICLPMKKALGGSLDVIRGHHEMLDGSGYPDGLRGEEVPVTARIMAVVDIYDALATDRPYRRGMNLKECFGIIGKMRDQGKLDSDIVDELTAMIRSDNA